MKRPKEDDYNEDGYGDIEDYVDALHGYIDHLEEQMKEVEIIEVIVTRILRRGLGKDEKDPIRIITQYWDSEGNLIFEIDPLEK